MNDFLLGGLVALSGAMLTLLSDWARGHIERRQRINDRRSEFQHATAAELQEALFEVGKLSLGLVVEMTSYNRDREGWKITTLSDEETLREQQLLTRINILKSRIDDPVVRDKVGGYIDLTSQTLKVRSMNEAEVLMDKWIETQRSTDEVIGRLVRDTWPSSRE